MRGLARDLIDRLWSRISNRMSGPCTRLLRRCGRALSQQVRAPWRYESRMHELA